MRLQLTGQSGKSVTSATQRNREAGHFREATREKRGSGIGA